MEELFIQMNEEIKKAGKEDHIVVLKDSGEVVLTATADDAKKTSKSIRLFVMDECRGAFCPCP